MKKAEKVCVPKSDAPEDLEILGGAWGLRSPEVVLLFPGGGGC